MFETLLTAVKDYPYLGMTVVFVLCGIGLPLPEEIALLAAGYLCAILPEQTSLGLMMVTSGAAILGGDLLPFLGGHVFGVRLLRLRWLRYFVTKQRLASFDRWFRKRGDMVILIARFLAGLRVVAFFTAGSMKMSPQRFLLLDGLGIALIVPPLIWLGYRSASFIEELITTVREVERGLLWGVLGILLLLGTWYWLWRRRRRLAAPPPTEAFVQPQRPVQATSVGPHPGDPGAPPEPLAANPPDPALPPTAADTAPNPPATPPPATPPAAPPAAAP
jgi:membrane protein DedA with SNARE-associated domain